MAASAGTWVTAHSGSGTSLTSGSIGTSTVGDALFLVTTDGNNGTAPTGSDSNSNSGWGALGTAQVGATSIRLSVNYTQNIATAGAGHTITGTWGSANNISLMAGYITGTAGAGAVDTGSLAATTDSTSPYQLTSNTPAQDDNYWLSFYGPPDAGLGTEVFTVPATWANLAQITDRNTSYCGCTAGKAIVSASAQSVTWADTSVTDDRLIKIVAVKSATSAEANQETIARRTLDVPYSRDRDVNLHLGWQAEPLSADAPLSEETINRRTLDLYPFGVDRSFNLHTGFQRLPLAADNVVSFASTHFGLPPSGQEQWPFDGFQRLPLAADNYESFARTHVDLPPAGEFTPYTSYDGFQRPANIQEGAIDARQGSSIFPDFHFPRHDPRDIRLFSGLQIQPTPADVVPVSLPTFFIPTYRPRRR